MKNYAIVEINPNPNHDSLSALTPVIKRNVLCKHHKVSSVVWKMESNVDHK